MVKEPAPVTGELIARGVVCERFESSVTLITVVYITASLEIKPLDWWTIATT